MHSSDCESVEEKQQWLLNNMNYRTKLLLLAEEASELSKAAIKLLRVIDDLNPAFDEQGMKLTVNDALDKVNEEVADVSVCLNLLDMDVDTELADLKLERLFYRITMRRDAANDQAR